MDGWVEIRIFDDGPPKVVLCSMGVDDEVSARRSYSRENISSLDLRLGVVGLRS